MSKIRITNEQAAIRALNQLREEASPKDDGTWQITISPIQTIAQEILANVVSIEPIIPDRTLRRLVYSSIFKWLRFKKYREDKDQVRGFIGALEREHRRLYRNLSNYQVLMLLCSPVSDLETFKSSSILGTTLDIKPWADLKSIDLDALWKAISDHNLAPAVFYDFELQDQIPRTGDFAPVLVHVNTFGPEAAVDIAQEGFDLLRACMNLPAISGQFTYFRSKPKPLSLLPPTPIYGVFSDEGKFINIYITNESYEYKRISISKRHAKAAITYLNKLNSVQSKEVAAVYTRCIRLYQTAIDIETTSGSYLALWNVLEAIADVSSLGITQREVKSRIATLIIAEPILNDLLNILVECRNKLVHEGEFPEGADPLYFSLKLVVDFSIARFLSLADMFESRKHIEEYLSMASLGDSVLSTKKDVIENIILSRTS